MTVSSPPQLLGTGTPGDLVAAAAAARENGRWSPVRDLVHDMTDQPVQADSDGVGLYAGAPAVAFALRVTGRFGSSRALSILDTQVAEIVERRLTAAEARFATGQPPRMHEYDLIRGMTGLGISLRCSNASPGLLDDVLRYLVRLLTESLNVADRVVPGWWTSDGPTGEPEAGFPDGHGNLSLAHGVAGPLTFLALAARDGLTVPGQLAAIESTASNLSEAARPTGTHGVLGWRAISQPHEWYVSAAVPTERPSWCYGTPGIAFAVQQAAIATSNHPKQAWAEAVLADALSDPTHLDLISDATICHGWSGAYLIADRAAADAVPGTALTRIATAMAHRISSATATDLHGLLTGPASIQLALNQIARDQMNASPAPATDWRACLLLDLPRSPTP